MSDLTALPDEELLARLQRGDLEVLGLLFDRYADTLRRYCARLQVPEEELDDLLQTLFLELPNTARRFDTSRSAKPWLFGVTTMLVRRNRRSAARALRRLARWRLDPPAPAEPVNPERETAARELASRAQAALAAMSHRKREAFVLVALEGLSGEEAATLLDIPVATVWTRLHHARRELRSALQEEVP